MSTPVDELRKPARPVRTALLVGAGALVAVGATWGGVAIAQTGQQDDLVEVTQTEPTETPTPEVPNMAPTVTIDTPTVDYLTITLTGTATDTDGEIASYGWNLGDGTHATGASVTHTYAAEGTYTVTFAVTDDDGAPASTTIEVTVTAPPPPPPPAQPATPVYGQYPPGHPMPMIPGTDAPDTSACASSTGTINGQGVPVCA